MQLRVSSPWLCLASKTHIHTLAPTRCSISIVYYWLPFQFSFTKKTLHVHKRLLCWCNSALDVVIWPSIWYYPTSQTTEAVSLLYSSSIHLQGACAGICDFLVQTIEKVFLQLIINPSFPLSLVMMLTLEASRKGGGGVEESNGSPTIILASNLNALTNCQKLWHNCSLIMNTYFDVNYIMSSLMTSSQKVTKVGFL